ncbi:MAG: phosphoglucosamine mutase [Ignavibacteria bacterium]|nr:phosphoglucosamine mutase [Ignavibacteria bacterium]
MAFIRSISGLRATLGDHLTPGMVANYSCAFSAVQPDGPIMIGNDGRPSGIWISEIVKGALRACGRTVIDAGMVPTPTIQLLVEKSDAGGGIVVTASHNPAEWNGLKFLDSTGCFLDAEGNQKLWDAVDTNSFMSDVQNENPNALSRDQQHGHLGPIDALDLHLLSVLAVLPEYFVQARFMLDKPSATVVVDAVHCSGSIIIPLLLRKLGFEVVELFCDSSGIFPHTPEPVTENLTQLCAAVIEHRAAFGVAVDPDADRLVLIDELGNAIGEECTVALAVKAAYELGGQGPAVVNFSTSRMTDGVASEYGFETHRSAVGEINVVNKMHEVAALIGGEGSGGVIFPSCHSGRDSVVGLALISWLLVRNERALTLSELRNQLPRLHMIKNKFGLSAQQSVAQVLAQCSSLFSGANISTVDGIYASWPDKWIHIRASNTEPIMRVIAEAKTPEQAEQLMHQVQDVIRG